MAWKTAVVGPIVVITIPVTDLTLYQSSISLQSRDMDLTDGREWRRLPKGFQAYFGEFPFRGEYATFLEFIKSGNSGIDALMRAPGSSGFQCGSGSERNDRIAVGDCEELHD
jgi:hypothetical protein